VRVVIDLSDYQRETNLLIGLDYSANARIPCAKTHNCRYFLLFLFLALQISFL